MKLHLALEMLLQNRLHCLYESCECDCTMRPTQVCVCSKTTMKMIIMMKRKEEEGEKDAIGPGAAPAGDAASCYVHAASVI